MRYFILFGHPEPELSFNAAMRDHAVERLAAAGHETVVSDLYAMGFNPVASGEDFAVRRFPDRLHYDREQKFAAAQEALAPDIERRGSRTGLYLSARHAEMVCRSLLPGL